MTWSKTLKIAVVGCGAVGSYYGGRLCQGGHEVHFLLRSDYETVRRRGVQIQSLRGDFHFRPVCAARPEEIGECELVVVALKTTANNAFPDLLPPLVGDQTAVLTLQNGLGNLEALERLFARDQILGGLCFVCLHRMEPGWIRHLDHGQIVLGEYGRRSQPRTHALASLMEQAGIPCRVTESLDRALWEKLIWNIPFNGLGVLGSLGALSALTNPLDQIDFGASGPCLATDALLGDPISEKLVRALMREVIGAARALGSDVPPEREEENIARTRSMGAYRASTLIDFERGRPLERDGMFEEPLRRAAEAGYEMPLLRRLCERLRRLDPGAVLTGPEAGEKTG